MIKHSGSTSKAQKMHQAQLLPRTKFLHECLAALNVLEDASYCLGSKVFLLKTQDGDVSLALENGLAVTYRGWKMFAKIEVT